MSESNTLPETGFLRIDRVLYFFPVGETTWWNGVKSGIYPKSVKISPGITAWRAEDIKALIDSFNDNTADITNKA